MLGNASSRLVVFVSLVVSISGCGGEPQPADHVAAVPAAPAVPARPASPIKPAAPAKLTPPAPPEKSASSPELTLIEAVNRGDLAKVVRTELSPDGKFLYANCWKPGGLVVFARDPETGKLTHVQTLVNTPELTGATGLAVSPDGRFAVVTAFYSKNTILFRRDHFSGKLAQLDIAPRTEHDVEFPVAAAFSPDGKFVCLADDGGRPGTGGVRVFRVEGEKLVDAGMDTGRNRCYYGARSLAFHPDGKTLFVACCRPGSLVVADFNWETGATKIRQILWATSVGGHDFSQPEVGGVPGIRGLVDVVLSADGRFATTCAGRFGGDTAVTSFKYGGDGHLVFVQGTKSSTGRFAGGNQCAVSPDGRSVYAAGTFTGVVACAARDPQTGKLTPRGVVADGGPPGHPGKTLGAAGVTISADGQFVYVATEDKNTLSVFRRNRVD
jgi:6-phosphogluconolactonase (cycloisomerase 2 family)